MFSKIIEKLLRKNRTFISYMERVEYLESRVANDYKEIKDVMETVVELNNLKRR